MCVMMYFRIALQTNSMNQTNQVDLPTTWKWRSTTLTSLQAVQMFLRTYSSTPKERVRVFMASSAEAMDEMLNRQNQGLVSSSITVDEFLQRKKLDALEVKRFEFELQSVGDHDSPYTFALPTTMPQRLAWTVLLTRVQSGELQP